PVQKPAKNALKVLFLDLSQFFSDESVRLDDVYDPPLGMITVMSYMNQRFAGAVKGKIAKARMDFDNYSQLKALLTEFQPDIIGARTLTFYREFFHKTLASIRQWGFNTPVIAGGPYATSNYDTILQDRNINLVALGEGEATFSHLLEKMLDNEGQFPDETVLKDIPGLAFIPGKRDADEFSREIVMMDEVSGFDASGGQGRFLKKLPLDPAKTFN
ncbi:MAG: hypothetical protein GY940_03615, partial [bacterium]|nr:hypothetical protein [bacterium]